MLRFIARLNEEDVPSPSGGGWTDSTIRGNARKHEGVLRHEANVGVLVYSRNLFRRTEKLTANYVREVTRLEELLEGTDEMVEANRLRELLGMVWVQPDANAGAVLRVEIRSTAPRLFCRDRPGANANGPAEGGAGRSRQ